MRLIGAKVPRVEDKRILTGRGRYIDDMQLPGMLHAAFLRSPMAHAAVLSIDTSGAKSSPGVVAVYSAAEVNALCAQPVCPNPHAMVPVSPTFYPMASERVRFVGDLVAMVIANSRYEAEDALDLIDVEYEPLTPVSGIDVALDPATPAVFDELNGNVIATAQMAGGDVDAAFAAADRVITASLAQHRITPAPMETRGSVADFDLGRGELTFHSGTQAPHNLRHHLARVIGHPLDQVRVISARDIGGAFGLKGNMPREDYCLAAVSRDLGRPVKFIEDRNENLIASGQCRDERLDAEVAVKSDGTILGIKAKLRMDHGAYPMVPFGANIFTRAIGLNLPGPYRIQGYSYEATVVTTNKCTYVPYRGPWEMETFARERLLDIVAHELDIDPAELRRKNMVLGEPEDRLITGASLAGVESRRTLDMVLEMLDYDTFRKEQAAARAEGRYLGVGMATFLEGAPGPADLRNMGGPGGMFGGDRAYVKLAADGHVQVITSQAPHGQSHETTLAQLAADEMGVPFDHVRVIYGDTQVTPYSLIGTGGSRSATWASGAVLQATKVVKDKVLAIAAAQLEIDQADLEIVDGVITPRGVPGKAIPLAQIAMTAETAPQRLPAGCDPVLESHEQYLGQNITGSGWSGGTHACIVEVDIDTGGVKILRYVVAEDCGRVINPAVVDGQVRGGVAQGIGEALFEHSAYDADGNFLASTFLDYLLPTSAEIPPIEIEHVHGADDDSGVGFRGVGEGGAIVAPATVCNAVDDALQPFGARVTEQPLAPARVLELAGVV